MGFDMRSFTAGIQRAEQQMIRAARQAEIDAAGHILESADIPRDTGALAASGHVESGDDGATIVFDKDYAAAVHEFEDPFLENAVVGERGQVGEIMANGIRRVT